MLFNRYNFKIKKAQSHFTNIKKFLLATTLLSIAAIVLWVTEYSSIAYGEGAAIDNGDYIGAAFIILFVFILFGAGALCMIVSYGFMLAIVFRLKHLSNIEADNKTKKRLKTFKVLAILSLFTLGLVLPWINLYLWHKILVALKKDNRTIF